MLKLSERRFICFHVTCVSSTANTVKPVNLKVHQHSGHRTKHRLSLHSVGLPSNFVVIEHLLQPPLNLIHVTSGQHSREKRSSSIPTSRTQCFFQPRKVHVIIVSIKIKKAPDFNQLLRISGTCTTVTIFSKNL